MIRIIFVLLVLFPAVCFSQNERDEDVYIDVKDDQGIVRKVKIVQPAQVLIVEGDSIYIISDERDLRQQLAHKVHFDIISNPDSVQRLLLQKIKAVIVIKHDPE